MQRTRLAEVAAGRRRGLLLAASVGVLALAPGCLLPLQRAGSVEGVLVDAETGAPVADALVVVRFDAWYDDAVPDRDALGHRESRSDARGRFRAGPVTRSGWSAWPLLQTEARLAGVMAEGYRCPATQTLVSGQPVRLTRARDADERRTSCRPVAAERGEARAYMEAWRSLYPQTARRESGEGRRELERVLAAREVFGFGANCIGPVVDVALDACVVGVALAVLGREGTEIQTALLGSGEAPQVVSDAPLRRDQQLAWTSHTELVLWEPDTQAGRTVSGSILGDDRFEVVWTAPGALPAAPDPGAPQRPLDPARVHDEADTRWMGRSFELQRDVDAVSGLARERLVVTHPGGRRQSVDLPGQACGARGRFGQPHYRLSADGASGVDLRFVDGGCHAVRVDLSSGGWSKIDAAPARARCRSVRSVPAQHMAAALRAYMRDVAETLEANRADPGTAFALHVDADGATRAVTRDLKGGKHTVPLPRFPLATPLRRIEITVAGGRSPTPRPSAPATRPQPL